MKLQRLLLAVTFALVSAVPAAAQRYTATQNGELIELADTTAGMNVTIVPAMGNAWKIQVKGQNLVRTSPTPDERRSKLIDDYKAHFANPYSAAERGYIDDVIEPRSTRPKLIRALRTLQTKRVEQPKRKHGNIPL